MKLRKTLLILLFAGIACLPAGAQKVSISTNLLDWANSGTINGTFSFAASRHLSFGMEARYNPWSFGTLESGNAFQNRVRGAALTGRYWPWTSYSSWWFGIRAQVDEYNRGGGLYSRRYGDYKVTEEGFAYGAGVGFGYSWMIARNLNLDLGLGLWAGRRIYTYYACPRCGRIMDSPEGVLPPYKMKDVRGWFILPSPDCQVSLSYIF